jgi:hypothetical protein
MFVEQINIFLQADNGEEGRGGEEMKESHFKGHGLTGWSASSSAP